MYMECYVRTISKKIIIIFLFTLILTITSCNYSNDYLNCFERKVYDSLRIAKESIKDFNNKSIKGVYNLIEDKEYFVIINISDSWYVLAIDTYDEMNDSKVNSSMMSIDGWRYTVKAKKGDIAIAPDILVDMAKSNVDSYNNSIDIYALNKSLGLKYTGNS